MKKGFFQCGSTCIASITLSFFSFAQSGSFFLSALYYLGVGNTLFISNYHASEKKIPPVLISESNARSVGAERA